MSAVLAIAWREVRERRFLLAAAATFSLLALTLQAAWPGAHDFGALAAIVLYLAFPPAAALAVGSSLIGRDLAEGRLSFYFSRPLSAVALWAGKFLGGAALVAGAFVCCYVPLASAAEGDIAREAFVAALLASLGLMGLAHVITAMYRSGSRLFALDLCLGAVFVTVFGAQVRHLATAGAGPAMVGVLLPVAVATVPIATMAAAAVQLACGRADAQRGHVGLSAAVWTLALAGFGALALWGAWVLRVTPADVGGALYPLFAAPRGSAVFFKGSEQQGRAGFSPIFLMDGQSGSYVRLPPERVTPPAFSADGATAVWVAPEIPWWWYLAPDPLEAARGAWATPDVPGAGPRGASLVVARLDRSVPVIEERRFGLPDAVWVALAVDRDGRRALLSGRSSVLLLDTSSGKRLASVPLSGVVAGDFLPDGVVRLYQKQTDGPGLAAFVVLDWNAKDGSRVERARIPGDGLLLLLARRGDLAVVSTSFRGKALIDAASGAVRRFDSATPESPGAALVLSDGRVALSLGEEVRIVTRGGDTVAKVPVDPKTKVYALREPAPGELAVGLGSLSLEGRRTVFLDATTGAVRREEKELLPAFSPNPGTEPQPEPGSLASRLFTDLDGALVSLEADGRRRVIVAARE